MNRIDRVTAILIHLQSRKIVKAQDIAERFDISLRTVYRDIRTLEEAGIPVVGEAGVGYSMMEGYRLPPVMFTKEEATAFLTAEKMVEKFTDPSTQASYKSAMYKVRAVLRSTEKNYLENIEDNIEVVENKYLPKNRHEAHHLQNILKSISDKIVLNIDYFANHSQEDTTRHIEPVGIYFSGTYWHLIAYCQMRKDYRDFRIDRITNIEETNLSFLKEHPSLKSYLSQISRKKELHTVVLRLDNEVISHLGDQKYYHGFVSQQTVDDKVEMTFLTSSLMGFARWYMLLGDRAEIITPDSLKMQVKEIAESVLKRVSY
jgi:predicted DNA-binding transcriptional regulator YafY